MPRGVPMPYDEVVRLTKMKKTMTAREVSERTGYPVSAVYRATYRAAEVGFGSATLLQSPEWSDAEEACLRRHADEIRSREMTYEQLGREVSEIEGVRRSAEAVKIHMSRMRLLIDRRKTEEVYNPFHSVAERDAAEAAEARAAAQVLDPVAAFFKDFSEKIEREVNSLIRSRHESYL